MYNYVYICEYNNKDPTKYSKCERTFFMTDFHSYCSRCPKQRLTHPHCSQTCQRNKIGH